MEFKVSISLEKLKATFSRFPVAFIASFAVSVALIYATQMRYQDGEHGQLIAALSSSALALEAILGVSVAIKLFSERHQLSNKLNYLLTAGACLVIAIISLILIVPDIQSYSAIHADFTGNIYRLLVLIALSMLSIFVLPFIKDSNESSWWNLTFSTIKNVIITSLYSLAIYAGIGLALAALDNFWGFKFANSQYEILAIILFLFYAPVHCLSLFQDIDKEEAPEELPKFLTALVKFILIPLVVIYTIIIYPYMAGFPFRAEWPANESTYIILAMLGLLYLIIYSINGIKSSEQDSLRIAKFTKIFTAISIPSILFWVYSLLLRINAYGVTVNRFVLMVIILWFLFNAIYYIFSKAKSIRFMLQIFVALMLICFYMPFSAFFWGEKSQIDILLTQAKDAGALKDGKIVNFYSGNDVTDMYNKYGNLVETLRYLNSMHTLTNTKAYLSSELIDKIKIDSYGYAGNIQYIYSSYDYPQMQYIYLVNNDDSSLKIPQGFSKVIYIDSYANSVNPQMLTLHGKVYSIDLNLSDPRIMMGDNSEANDGGIVSPSSYMSKDQDFMTFKSSDGSVLVIQYMSFYIKDSKISEISNLRGIMFVK